MLKKKGDRTRRERTLKGKTTIGGRTRLSPYTNGGISGQFSQIIKVIQVYAATSERHGSKR